MIARTGITLFLLASSPFASMQTGKTSKFTLLHSARYSDCFAMCEHASHGSYSWLGPLRSGHNGATQAANDAAAHNNTNKGHAAWSSCNEPE